MTHKLQNNYTKESLTMLGKLQDPQQISEPGDLAKGLRTPREFDVGGQWDLITELSEDWRKSLWEGTNKPSAHQDPGERTWAHQDPQETDPDLPVSVQESLAEAWSAVSCCRIGGTECSSVCMDLLKGGRLYLHYHNRSLVSGQTTGNTAYNQQKIG